MLGERKRAQTPAQIERNRRRAGRTRTLQLRAMALILVAAALWGGWYGLSRSGLFRIEAVDVTGTSRLSADEVIALAAIPDGATLLGVDAAAIESRLGENSWIVGADVSRRLPATLRIEIEERVASAVVDTGVTFWFVDTHGRVLAESVPDSATVLPVIRDLPDFVAEPGQVSDSTSLTNALGVLAGIDDELLATVRTVSAPSVNETALLTTGSVEIMVGEARQLGEKSVLVRDILGERGNGIVFIDVRSVERPISRGLAP